jgi:hypothetical protein
MKGYEEISECYLHATDDSRHQSFCMDSVRPLQLSKKLSPSLPKVSSKARQLKPIKLEPILNAPTPTTSIPRTKLNKHEPLLSKRERLARAAEMRLEKQRQEQDLMKKSAAVANP